MLGAIPWDPNPIMFTLPVIDWPIRWYGFFFALGFFIAYFMMIQLFKSRGFTKDLSQKLTDRLCWYVVIGTVVGARLGHVLFYEPHYYLAHPLSIFKTWEGGLASHGGVISIPLAMALFFRNYREELKGVTLLSMLDQLAVVVPFCAFFIRLGNFFNQEIIGTPTSLPWGVRFGRPYEGIPGHVYHAVQLYEGFAYLAIFGILLYAWKKSDQLKDGFITGLFFTLLFTARFFIEFLKISQGVVAEDAFLQMGQILSIPCIIGGLYLMLRKPKDCLNL